MMTRIRPLWAFVGQALVDLWDLVKLLGIAGYAFLTEHELDQDDRDRLLFVEAVALAATLVGGWLWWKVGWPVGATAAAIICVSVYYATRRPPDPREGIVRRLEDAVAQVTKVDADDPPVVLVRNCAWHVDRHDPKLHGWTTCTVHWTSAFNDGEQRNLDKMHRQIEANLGVRVDFEAHTARNYARVNLWVDTLPTVLPLQLSTGRPWHEIPIGRGDRNRVEKWDLKRAPHALITASTGAGKTTVLRAIAAHALANRDRHGWRVRGCDPKRIELRFLRGLPGVERVASTKDAMVKIVCDTRDDMEAWYAADEAGDNPDPLSILLIVDEVAELAGMAKGTPFTQALSSLVRLGRSARIHVVLATQRPDVAFISGESRANLRYRVATGPLDQAGSSMVFGDAKVGQGQSVAGGRASDIPGRVLVSDDGTVRDAQAFWVADPQRLNPDAPRTRARGEQADARALFPTPTGGWDTPQTGGDDG